MIQYPIPIRNNTPQKVGPYTFLDQNGNVIDLTLYASASLEIKQQGFVFATVPATIMAPATNGQVQVLSYTFVGIGIWDVQFYFTDSSGKNYYGEPLQIRVVANVEDLTLSQLASY
jgi:hypothetical protein